MNHELKQRVSASFASAVEALVITAVVTYLVIFTGSKFQAPLASIYAVAIIMPPVLLGLTVLAIWTGINGRGWVAVGSLLSLAAIVASDYLLLGRLEAAGSIQRALMILLPPLLAGSTGILIFCFLVKRKLRKV